MKQYFPALTGFRAIAAWIVFAHHYNPFPRNSSIGYLSELLHESYIGVTLFFVLSGFLITIRYDSRNSQRRTFSEYLRNRFARIYPLYFLLTTLTFLIAIQWDTIKYLAAITFIQGFLPQWQFTGINQSWSLTVEETFYFLAPMLFFVVRTSRLFFLWPFAFLAIGLAIYLPSGSTSFMLQYTFFGRSFDFFMGMVLAKIYQNQQPTTRNSQLVTWSGVLGIILAINLLALVRGDATYGVFTVPGLFVHHLLLPASTALLIYGLITEDSWPRKFLSAPVMLLLGRSSYAFYLIHIGFIAAWLPGNIVVRFLLLNVIAIGLYYAVERPIVSFSQNPRKTRN